MSPNIQMNELSVAMQSIKRAKNMFSLFILVALVSQVASFVLVHYYGVINEATAVLEHLGRPTVNATDSADLWYRVLQWSLPMGKFLGFACGLLLAVTLMFAAALALFSPNGGVKGMYSAFFWSLILLSALTPWQQILQGSLISGAFYNLGDLLTWAYKLDPPLAGKSVSFTKQLPYFARFLAYPAVTFLVWLVVLFKFAGGYKKLFDKKQQTSQPTEPSIR